MVRVGNLSHARSAVIAVRNHRAFIVARRGLRAWRVDELLELVVQREGIKRRLLRDVDASSTRVVLLLGEVVLPDVRCLHQFFPS